MAGLAGAVALFALAPGCSLQRLTSRLAVQLIGEGVGAINGETDIELARAGAAASLKLLDALVLNDPANHQLLLLGAQGYVGYATAFAQQERPRATVLYARGRDYALRAWSAFLGHEPRLDALALAVGGGQLETLLGARDGNSVPYAYWTAASWAGLIDANRDDPQLLADLPVVQRLASFVATHDVTYASGGADLLLGVLAGTLPAFAGGNPQQSRSHFERSLQVAERRFLMAQVLYAETYAVAQQDRALFDRLLAEVDAANIDILPSERLANTVAKQRAAALRARADRLFL